VRIEGTGGQPLRTVAAELVNVLQDEGISHLFINPGMNTTPLREAFSNADVLGLPHPQPILCMHENVALSAAHGHHLVSGSRQAVMVHVEKGDLRLGGAAENAHRNRIPVTVFCGDGGEWANATTERPAPPESVVAEPGMLSSIGRWAADLSRAEDPGMLIRRAFQIASAEPAGLTSVALPVGLLGQPAGPPSRRLLVPSAPAPDLAALDAMAELLAAARWPLILAGRVGRNVASVLHLARLAEVLGAPVIDIRNNVNLPPGHSLNAGRDGSELLARADAILLLDVDVPCVPGLAPLPRDAWLLQIDVDCIKADWPGWTYPIAVAVTADTQIALPLLVSLLDDRLGQRRRQIQERRDRVRRAVHDIQTSWAERAASTAPEDQADVVLAELNRSLPEDAVIMEEVAIGFAGTIRQLQRPPGHLFRSWSPGWSIGAALGARLARPGQPAVAICDPSAFGSALPSAALWSAHRAGAPFLTIVLDRDGQVPGTDQDVRSIATASGAEVAVVHSPTAVAETLDRLLATTRDGVCTVMDVRLPAAQRADQTGPRRRGSPLTTASRATRQQGV
jgi:acetolactate synthase I/II/III large subunit